jgi:hypothetical protein
VVPGELSNEHPGQDQVHGDLTAMTSSSAFLEADDPTTRRPADLDQPAA